VVLTLVVFLVILTVSVVVHELAHYLNARSVGVPVRAFSVGMGPVLLRKRWRGTEWRLSLLPLGGYVDLQGLAPEQAEDGSMRYPDEGFMRKNFPQKTWVLIGGVIANFILAVLLLASVITAEPNAPIRALITGETPATAGAVFEQVMPDSAAERFGLEAGDVVLRINGVRHPTVAVVQEQIRTASALNLLVKRGSEQVRISEPWPPAGVEGVPLLGVGIAPLNVESLPPLGFGTAVLETTGFLVRVVPESVAGFVRAFGQTFAGQRSQEVVGPVGMVGLAGQAAQGGLISVLTFAGLINFSLALFNLLPIPGLDGGRILLAAVVALRGKPFKPGQEEFVNFLGIALLLLFVVLVSFGEVGDLLRR
jgi:regulator of sigma E protease